FRTLDIERMAGQRAISDIVDPKSGETLVRAGRRITRAAVKKVKNLDLNEIEVSREDLAGKVIARPVIDESTGEIISDANSEMSNEILDAALEAGISEFKMIFFDGLAVGPYLRNTLLMDKVATEDEALIEIYKRLRPGEPPTEEAATAFFQRLFFDAETYDLSEVGRLKINHKFNISFEDTPVEHRTPILRQAKKFEQSIAN
ncbi:MAG: DNA-directed RNA polymerase subunit beta, partial [Deinococcota bacterium]